MRELKEILSRIDHTLVKPDVSIAAVRELIDEGAEYGVALVTVPPAYVRRAVAYADSRVKIGTVVGFPYGFSSTSSKMFETSEYLSMGASELDMMINIGDVRDRLFDHMVFEISAIKSLCGNITLKVIIETCLLSEEEKIKLCQIVTEAGADFIKTSTGFVGAGATVEDVKLLCANVGENVKVKAAGGINTLEFASALLDAGAQRLGTSRIVKFLKSGEITPGY